jgi:soluble P-type ATPase
MLEIVIPSRGVLRLEYLVLDVNRAIALDGQLLQGIGERPDRLGELLAVWPVSADTQDTLTSLASNLKVQSRHL